MNVGSVRLESTGSRVNLGQLASGRRAPKPVPSTPEPRLSWWWREESLTGHVVLVQLLEGEGDTVQLGEGHPDVLQHGPFLLLQAGGRQGAGVSGAAPAPGSHSQTLGLGPGRHRRLGAGRRGLGAGLPSAGCGREFACPTAPGQEPSLLRRAGWPSYPATPPSHSAISAQQA